MPLSLIFFTFFSSLLSSPFLFPPHSFSLAPGWPRPEWSRNLLLCQTESPTSLTRWLDQPPLLFLTIVACGVAVLPLAKVFHLKYSAPISYILWQGGLGRGVARAWGCRLGARCCVLIGETDTAAGDEHD